MVGRPEVDVDGIEDGEEGETPADAFDDGAVTVFCELVDDGAEQEYVNGGPRGMSVVCSNGEEL